ncbi:Sphingomyelin phosphodiesterase [Eumeta japonica]|uniref:Sphingomyelin phosphodiesterase n=1 Tax=Eumeta variegata TaxID=151549 RepID=A0A4C1XAE3_EUMVA|nr:Sphingomyelin phosphodiesterase [Eumeta japonica]
MKHDFRPSDVSPRAANFTLTIDCLVCRSAFVALEQGVAQGQSYDELTDIITTLCVSLGIENYNVCYGAVKLNMPILVYIIRNTPIPVGQTFCALVLQGATNPNVCPHNDDRFEWQVELPPPPTNPVVQNNDLANLKIALITDAHIDPLYEPFGVGNCGEPTCCRIGQKPDVGYRYEVKIDQTLIDESVVVVDGEPALDLDYADIIKRGRQESRNRFPANRDDNAPAGYWGDYRDCDTPIWAFDDVIERMASTHKDIDMVYYVGDTIDHGVWETSYDLINEMNAYLIDKLKESFGDNVPVVPVLGNHESQPTNQKPTAPNVVVTSMTILNSRAALVKARLLPWGLENLRVQGQGYMVDALTFLNQTLNICRVAKLYVVWRYYDEKPHRPFVLYFLLESHEQLAAEIGIDDFT